MRLRRVVLGLFFCVVALSFAVVGGMLGVWQSADHLVFRALYLPRSPAPAASLRIIDVDYPDEARQEQPERFRAALASALTQLAALSAPPRVVLIDVWISSNPAGAQPLIEAIAALRAKGVKVYAAVQVKDRHGKNHAEFMKTHHEAIYAKALDGFGHTQLDYAFGVLKYDRELVLPLVLGELRVPALPLHALIDAQRNDALPASLVIPLGADEAFKPMTHRLASAAAQVEPALPANAPFTYAIIGSLVADSDNVLKRPGPLLLAWAISDLLAGKASVAREPLNHPVALLGLAVLVALFAWGTFALLFRGLRTRVTPPRWHALAGALAPFSFAVSALLLLGVGGIVLLAGRVIPVAFPLVCAALGAWFAWLGARRWIAHEQTRRDLAGHGEERAVRYDVFVSYAHDPAENKAWVKREIVAALAAQRHADGTAYRIFFDEAEIKVGRQWKSEIELALLGSRCFLPVYSENYFKRPYCREEMEIADQLRIEGRLQMFPVAREGASVPERYLRKAQYIDTRTTPGFIQELIEQVAQAVKQVGTK